MSALLSMLLTKIIALLWELLLLYVRTTVKDGALSLGVSLYCVCISI